MIAYTYIMRARFVCVVSPCAWHRPNTCRPIDKEGSRDFACRGIRARILLGSDTRPKSACLPLAKQGRSRLKRQADFGRLVANFSEAVGEPSRKCLHVLCDMIFLRVMLPYNVACGARAPTYKTFVYCCKLCWLICMVLSVY